MASCNLILVRRMKRAVVLVLVVIVPAAVLRSERAPSARSTELAIVAVTFQASMSVRVTDDQTGAPIPGATVRLLRSREGRTLAPDTARSDQTAGTDRRGTAHLTASLAGTSALVAGSKHTPAIPY
jgi:hypothetical protein